MNTSDTHTENNKTPEELEQAEKELVFKRSIRVPRSPTEQKSGKQEAPQVHGNQRQRLKTIVGDIPEIPVRSGEPRTSAKPTKEQNVEAQTIIVGANTHKPEKMNTQQIFKDVVNYIPEFSGENVVQSQSELSRFLNSADGIYNTLKTNEEKQTFNRCIKLRLTGEAYMRIDRRQTDNYETLRKILTEMYTKVYSLEELHRNFLEIRQKYGETVRCFGYRLCEVLDQYKKGYMIKYKCEEIDKTYVEYLNDTAIQTFKRGLNNTILREKVATHRAKTVEEIMEETETIEKMLSLTADAQPQHTASNVQAKWDYQTNYMRKPPKICYYCQRQNHTFRDCRTRLNDEKRKQTLRYQQANTQTQQQPNYRERVINNNGYLSNIKPIEYRTNLPMQTQQVYTKFAPPGNTGFTGNTYQNRFSNRPPKYCSFCKTTSGHTFEECRSKYRRDWNQTNITQPNKPQETDGLEKQFSNMRINAINTKPPDEYQINNVTRQFQNQENCNGSSQL